MLVAKALFVDLFPRVVFHDRFGEKLLHEPFVHRFFDFAERTLAGL